MERTRRLRRAANMAAASRAANESPVHLRHLARGDEGVLYTHRIRVSLEGWGWGLEGGQRTANGRAPPLSLAAMHDSLFGIRLQRHAFACSTERRSGTAASGRVYFAAAIPATIRRPSGPTVIAAPARSTPDSTSAPASDAALS